MKPRYFTATDDDINACRTTDIYFVRTMEILKAKGMLDEEAFAEMTVGSLPNCWKWGVFCGLEEALRFMEGRDVDIYGVPEGTIFPSRTQNGLKLPLLSLEGKYSEYCMPESPMLGFMCHSTGVATMAARCRIVAEDKPMMAFGVRRSHPAISPMLDRSSYIGGCDGVSSLMGAEIIGEEPNGTMPHALIVMMGSSKLAFAAFDEIIDSSVQRIALADTYSDEKSEAVLAAETIKDLYGIRLDTPASRRGSFPEIIKEVRWELDIRGFTDVKIIASGGLDETTIPDLIKAGIDGFGVGTSISNAPTVDFALDIVEKDGKPVAKRGKLGGRKHVFRCLDCNSWEISSDESAVPVCLCCGSDMKPAFEKLMEGGKRIYKEKSPKEIRSYVLKQLETMEL